MLRDLGHGFLYLANKVHGPVSLLFHQRLGAHPQFPTALMTVICSTYPFARGSTNSVLGMAFLH
jgi:hypothetical protein